MTKVNIRPIKAKAVNFPDNVRNLILSEKDELDADEFLIKIETWEKLLRMES